MGMCEHVVTRRYKMRPLHPIEYVMRNKYLYELLPSSIQSSTFSFLLFKAKKKNLCGYKLQNKVHKNKNNKKKTQRKSQHLRKNMIQVQK